ncbi:MAG: hypothetical protein WBG46_12210, partial [Nonlabens sp.]
GSTATFPSDRTGQTVQQGLKANTILLRGGFVNVNGLIQAGKSDFTLTLDNEIRNRLLAANGTAVPINVDNNDFLARYDSTLNRLTIVGMNPKGGKIDIEGRIVATSKGQLVSHAGYPRITIDNQMQLNGTKLEGMDLVIEDMDVSLKGEGLIILKDKNRGVREDGSDLAMYFTQYSTDANGVVTTTDGLIDPVTWGAGRAINVQGTGVVNAAATHSSGTNITTSTGSAINSKLGYQTVDGMRYGWVVGQGKVTEIIQEKTYNSWLGIDFLIADIIAMPVVDTTLLDSTLIPNSNYFYFDSNPDTAGIGESKAYTYNSNTVITDRTYEQTAYNTTTSWYGKTSTFVQYTTVETSFTKHNHTIAADQTIDISFTGYNTSTLDIDAGQANLIVAGKITNENGLTRLEADGTITTERVAAQGLAPTVGGRFIDITGLSGVGERDFGVIRPEDGQLFTAGDSRAANALRVDQSANGTLDVTSNGDIFLKQTSGDLLIGDIISNGDGLVEILAGDRGEDVVASNGGSILNDAGGSLVKGGSIRLDSDGAIGGTSAIVIDTGTRTNDVLTAVAADDINLYQDTNDLRVFEINSSGGNVLVTMRGDNDIIDANQIQEADTRSREALLGGVWGDMELLGDVGDPGQSPAELKILEAIERLNSGRVEDYRTYWDWRNLYDLSVQADVDEFNALVGDPSVGTIRLTADGDTSALKASIVAQLVAGGLDETAAGDQADDQIDTAKTSRTAQFLEQHARYGGQASEDMSANLDLTSPEEKQAIRDSIKVWTQSELLNAIGSGLLKPVTDTTVNIEAPNIVGGSVTLDTRGNVGRTEGDVTILLNKVEIVGVTFDQGANSMTRSAGSWN